MYCLGNIKFTNDVQNNLYHLFHLAWRQQIRMNLIFFEIKTYKEKKIMREHEENINILKSKLKHFLMSILQKHVKEINLTNFISLYL